MLPVGQLLLYGLQHVMSMYAGVIAVPLIVGTALGLPFPDLAYLLTAALLVSGLATLLQTIGVWRIGARLPLVQGASFAAVASMLAIGTDAGGGVRGLQFIFGAILVAGIDRVPAVGRVQPPAALLPARRDGVGHHGDRHLAAAGGDPLGRRWRGDRPHLRQPRQHRARRAHPGDHPGDLPVPARLLQPHRHPRRARHRDAGRDGARHVRLQQDRAGAVVRRLHARSTSAPRSSASRRSSR